LKPEHLILIATVAVANLGLGAAIWLRDPRGAIHRYFGLFSVSVAAWTVSNGLVSTYAGTEWGFVWARLAFASASIIPISFLFFSSVFPTSHFSPPNTILKAFLIVAVAAFISSLTPLMVKGTTSSHGKLQVLYGPLHLPFAIYLIACFAFSMILLTKKLLRLTGIEKLQVRYLFAGVLTAAVGATISNLIIPLAFGTSEFSRYGPLFGIVMIAVIAHAIIRYRLMDIKVVIRKGVVYVCAILAAASILLVLAEVIKQLTGYEKDTIPLFESLMVALILAILFQPLKDSLQRSLNRYVYRETYDYQRTVREASRRLSAILDLESLLDYLVRAIENTFKVEAALVYLRDSTGKTFQLSVPSVEHRHAGPAATIPNNSPLVQLLEQSQRVLVREEAALDVQDPGQSRAAQELQSLGGDVAFPLLSDHRLVGILLVGPKRSGDPYFAQDIDLLETLISQGAVAMKNAQLYRQVVLVNEYVDNILSTMDSGVIAVNAAGNISLFNSAAERLTGLRAADLQTKPYQGLPSDLASPLKETLEAEKPRSQFETTVHGHDGSRVPVVCSTAILKHRDGSTHGALLVFSDLTRLKDLEREKRRAERLASFGALASGVAHEIKNPLVAIRTFAELLPERFADLDFREDFSKVVIREIARIDDLVGRLRGIAAAPQQTGEVDIRHPIAETMALLRAQLEHTRTTVHCTFDDSAPYVAVEEAQLKQLFLNLMLNAIEAMGPGGELTLRVARKEIHGSAWIVTEIADTGPGIPDSLKGSIFEPFFTTKPRGSGLGLAICRGITDAHRGSIRAENRMAGPGTVMVVEFRATAHVLVRAEEKLLTS